MSTVTLDGANLALAYGAYLLGTASPGPSNLAIMGAAMTAGRRRALMMALGVVSGSLVWGLLAAFGLAAAIASYATALTALKIGGGCYLLWLAFKSARSALSTAHEQEASVSPSVESPARSFARGAALHLTNPKAIFVWLSIVALGLPKAATREDALFVVLGCAAIGLLVFCGYAVLFSTARARSIYRALRRWFDATLAVLFGFAGLRMLLSRVA